MKEKTTDGIAVFIAATALGIGAWLLNSWLLMLLVGIAHITWLHSLPLMGWNSAYQIGLILSMLASGIGLYVKRVSK